MVLVIPEARLQIKKLKIITWKYPHTSESPHLQDFILYLASIQYLVEKGHNDIPIIYVVPF